MVKKASNSKIPKSESAVPVRTSSKKSPKQRSGVLLPIISNETIHTAPLQIPDYLRHSFNSLSKSFKPVHYEDLRFNGAHYFADLGLKSYLLILHQIASQNADEKQLFICPDDLSAYHFQAELNTISKPHADNSEVITANQASHPQKPIKFLDYKSLGLENESDIDAVVDKFINKNNLLGTSKLYFYQGEHLSTDLGSRFFKSLVSKLKTQKPNLQVFAISNYDITHETSNHEPLSSINLYGQKNKLPGIKLIRSQKNISAVEVEGILSYGALEDHRAVISAGKGDDHNNSLLDKVQAELRSGSKKILIKTSSRDQIDILAKLAKSRNLNIGFYNSKKSPPSNSVNNGSEKTYDNPYELIKAWGKDFDVLVHCQKFDGMEIPADCLFIADTTDSDYELAKIIAPVFTLDDPKKPKKIYYLHGESNDFQARLARIHSHNQHRISGGMSSSPSYEGSPILASPDIVENGESRPLPALGLFWDIFGRTNINFRDLASNYLNSNSLSSEVLEPGRLAENIKLGYDKNLFTQEINLVDIYRYAFTYCGKLKDLSNAISTYPSLLGIRSPQEASDRVLSVYKPIYKELQSSSVLNEFNNTGNQQGETVWRLNSSIIAEFLFTQAPQYLTQQDFYAPDKKYDQVLAEVISVLMGVKKDFAQDSPLATLKLDFQKFLNQKRLAREAETKKNSLDMTKQECQNFVENFLLEDSANQGLEDIDESKIPILTDAFYGLQKILGDEDLNARFYAYVIDKKPESKNPILLASILPPKTDDDKKFLINSLMSDFPEDLVTLFSTKKKNLNDEFQQFLLNKYPDKSGSRESIETFIRGFNDLNSPKIREFLKSVFGDISPEIYEALKFKLEFENIEQKIEFLKYKLKKSIKTNGNAIDTQSLDLTKILREANIDLEEVFSHLKIVHKSITPASSVDNTYVASPEFIFLFTLNKPFLNYLKAELVLAELLKQIYTNKTLSRIVEFYNDDEPEDTNLLIVKFVNSYTPKIYFLDPGVRKPSSTIDIGSINLDSFNTRDPERKFLSKLMNYYLEVLPYWQYNESQIDVLRTKLSELNNLIKSQMQYDPPVPLLYIYLTHFYLVHKKESNNPENSENPQNFLRFLFDELLSSRPSGFIDLFKILIPTFAEYYDRAIEKNIASNQSD